MRTHPLSTLIVPFLLLFASPVATGADLIIRPDGTGDHPTIQAGLAAVQAGDTLLLADGIFKGPGNRDIDFLGKAVTVRSMSGRAACCVIDPEGSKWTPRRAFDFKSDEGALSVVRDLTIRNGSTDDC